MNKLQLRLCTTLLQAVFVVFVQTYDAKNLSHPTKLTHTVCHGGAMLNFVVHVHILDCLHASRNPRPLRAIVAKWCSVLVGPFKAALFHRTDVIALRPGQYRLWKVLVYAIQWSWYKDFNPKCIEYSRWRHLRWQPLKFPINCGAAVARDWRLRAPPVQASILGNWRHTDPSARLLQHWV